MRGEEDESSRLPHRWDFVEHESDEYHGRTYLQAGWHFTNLLVNEILEMGVDEVHGEDLEIRSQE